MNYEKDDLQPEDYEDEMGDLYENLYEKQFDQEQDEHGDDSDSMNISSLEQTERQK